jgi:hypothetical protein
MYLIGNVNATWICDSIVALLTDSEVFGIGFHVPFLNGTIMPLLSLWSGVV